MGKMKAKAWQLKVSYVNLYACAILQVQSRSSPPLTTSQTHYAKYIFNLVLGLCSVSFQSQNIPHSPSFFTRPQQCAIIPPLISTYHIFRSIRLCQRLRIDIATCQRKPQLPRMFHGVFIVLL
jgi:hypothetical protein